MRRIWAAVLAMILAAGAIGCGGQTDSAKSRLDEILERGYILQLRQNLILHPMSLLIPAKRMTIVM